MHADCCLARFGTSRHFVCVAVAIALCSMQAPTQAPVNRTIIEPDAAAPAAGGPLAPAFARARAAVVHVFVEVAGTNVFKLERPSSGVVIGSNGLVVTHWDLVREAQGATDKSVFVQLADATRTRLAAKIAAHDVASGLALLQAEVPVGTALVAIDLADAPAPGDPAAVLSYHDGEDHVGFGGIVAFAVGGVTTGDLKFAPSDILLTDAAIQARSHGAALIAADGGLLGLCNASRVATEVSEPTLQDLKRSSFGFVIPTRAIKKAFAYACKPAEQASSGAAAKLASVEARAVARVQDSVVAVLGGEAASRPALGDSDPYAVQRRARVGSGVIVDTNGLVFTNRHLVDGASVVSVTLRDGTTCVADVVETHASTNSALLKMRLAKGAKVTAIPCGSLAAAAVGDVVLAVGNPEGHALTLRQGVLSAVRGRAVQTDAGVGNHNAGGALVSMRGELLAIIDGGARDLLDVAFARRGEQAKVETSLDLSPSIDTLREIYRTALDRDPGTNASLAKPETKASAAPSGVAAVVARTAGSMLNIYVEIKAAALLSEDNPFAPPNATTLTESLGSGVIIDVGGLALTNWHVVDAATEPDGSMTQDRVVRAKLRDGRVFDADVLSISREQDLALLRLRVPADQTVDAVALGASGALAVGDQTVAIGNPHGRADTVTAGVVTAKNQAIRVKGRWAKLPHLLETDAAINAGNSGGALLDSQGRLIGINSAGGSLHAVTGFSISVDHVREMLRSVLLSPEKLRSAYAGLSVVDVEGKVVVQSVDRHGPCAAAGVATGDVVCAVGEVAMRWSGDFALAWSHIDGGATVSVEFERDGKREVRKVTPLSAAAWAVFRQVGLDVSELGIGDDAAKVRAAAIAMDRQFTGDPTAVPSEFPASCVRVVRVHPAVEGAVDVRPGDLVLGVVLRSEGADAEQLLRFQRVEDVQRCVNEHSTYEGETFRTWLYRDGAVRLVELTAKRLMW